MHWGIPETASIFLSSACHHDYVENLDLLKFACCDKETPTAVRLKEIKCVSICVLWKVQKSEKRQLMSPLGSQEILIDKTWWD